MMNEVQQNILKFLRQTENTSGKNNHNGYYEGNNRKRKISPLNERTEKRKRSSNFHSQEIDTLLALVKRDKRTIECKKTDQITNTYKDMAWKRISHIFNDRNLTKRSDKQLRSKWETLKKNARREHSANKLSELSGKVLNILDLDEDLDPDFPLHLKEEPIFDDMSYENTENIEMEQHISKQQEKSQESKGKEVFQTKVPQSSNTKDKSLEEQSLQQSDKATILPHNVQWKPIIAQAFVAPPGLIIPQGLSQMDDEHHVNKKKERMYDFVSPAVEVLDKINTKFILSKTLSFSRGTQCNNTKASQKKIFKKSFCCHILAVDHLKYLYKKMMVEENKRKKEKHQIEMDILKTELMIKKKQLKRIE
ncbi:hypothetical protein WA026_017433 [Henosepilachna vigintioctopunctata]|uniref:Regulatory protein zeste n=1 Tax=Henosepilachna vigintioctopunctata TaxID=420089 RepID=A0AAW1VHQ4_9CUCU